MTFKEWILDIKERHEKDKVVLGMEPTGHYWFNLGKFLQDNEMKPVLVNPHHVKKSKELDGTTHLTIDMYNTKLKHPHIADVSKLVWIVDHNVPSDSPKTAASQKDVYKRQVPPCSRTASATIPIRPPCAPPYTSV